jgi:UDP-glucose 4-epimerase
MKCIVTGGAGFIGSHLVEALLKNKNKVIVLDNLTTGREVNIKNFKKDKNFYFFKTDISKEGKWVNLFNNADYVFHIAALADIVPSIQKPKKYFDSNVVGTLNVLEACKKYKVKKIIYSASSSCYGIPDNYPTNENSQIRTLYPYALTKYMGEQLICHWGSLYKIPYMSLRFFNVYGTRSRTSGTYGAVFGVFLAQKLAKKPFTVVGDGKQTRDFTYVTDVVAALVNAAYSKKKNEIINIGSGKPTSVNQLIKYIDKNNKIVFVPKRPGEPDCTHANILKAKKILKWSPRINIKQGVDKILKEIDYWKFAPVWTKNKIYLATKDWFKFLK